MEEEAVRLVYFCLGIISTIFIEMFTVVLLKRIEDF